VIKQVINDEGGTAVASDFTMTVAATNPSPVSFPGVEAPGTVVSLDPGSFDVTEAGPGGYAAISVGCTGDIAAGETKTCTITNDDVPAQLIVVKHVINDDGGAAVASDFTMNVEGANAIPSSFTGDESGTTVSVNAGPYSVDETGPSGYAKSFSADCSGSIALAETKTCTVTNNDVPRGSIIVEKQTIPSAAAGTFTFSGDASGSIPDNGQIIVTDLPAGTYTSTEVDLPPGFSLTSIVCDDGNSEGDVAAAKATIRLDDGENVVRCVFTNRLETTPTPTPTPTPTTTASPTPTLSQSPTSTPTQTSTEPSPTATATVTETPSATVPPVVAPETLTPQPTPTPAPSVVVPGTPAAPPATGGGGWPASAGWLWPMLSLISAAVLMLAGGYLAVYTPLGAGARPSPDAELVQKHG
jgi:hypothetical protein